MATGTSIASGTMPTCTACTTSPSQVWPKADSRGPWAPGGSSRKMSRGCPLASSCSIAWKRVGEGGCQGQSSIRPLYPGLAPYTTTRGTHRTYHSPCKDPLRAVQGVGLWGQEKSPKLLKQSSVGHKAEPDEGRGLRERTKQEASESLSPSRANLLPA